MENILPIDLSQFTDAANVIKHAIERCRYCSAAAVNRETLSLYFGVGKFVSENSRKGHWGKRALPTISELLQRELPGLRGFSATGLKRMRAFYEEWTNILIRPTMSYSLKNQNVPTFRPTVLGELTIDERLLLDHIN